MAKDGSPDRSADAAPDQRALTERQAARLSAMSAAHAGRRIDDP
jgi:hypothetical protein